MIAEGAVVRMFLNSHYLDGVITVGRDARKCLLPEFIVCAESFLILCHTDMALIYKERLHIRGEFLYLEFVRLLRIINFGRENLCHVVLHYSCGVSRDSFPLAAIPADKHLVEVSVVEGILGKTQLPIAVAYRLELIFIICLPI